MEIEKKAKTYSWLSSCITCQVNLESLTGREAQLPRQP